MVSAARTNRGLKLGFLSHAYAALKRRSSTVFSGRLFPPL